MPPADPTAAVAVARPLRCSGERSGWVKDGLLLSYGQDILQSVRRGTQYIDKILRGAKPADLPKNLVSKELMAKVTRSADYAGCTGDFLGGAGKG